MDCFVVIVRPGQSGLNKSVITKKFPNHYEVVENCVWIVASKKHRTTVSVCKSLGLDGTDDSKAGIVFELNEYNGYFSRSLWEILRSWERET